MLLQLLIKMKKKHIEDALIHKISTQRSHLKKIAQAYRPQ